MRRHKYCFIYVTCVCVYGVNVFPLFYQKWKKNMSARRFQQYWSIILVETATRAKMETRYFIDENVLKNKLVIPTFHCSVATFFYFLNCLLIFTTIFFLRDLFIYDYFTWLSLWCLRFLSAWLQISAPETHNSSRVQAQSHDPDPARV